MSGHIRAPFTPEQVEVLNEWQKNDQVHPFTCGCPGGSGPHTNLLTATESGWECKKCGTTQDWAHDFMLERDKWPTFPPEFQKFVESDE